MELSQGQVIPCWWVNEYKRNHYGYGLWVSSEFQVANCLWEPKQHNEVFQSMGNTRECNMKATLITNCWVWVVTKETGTQMYQSITIPQLLSCASSVDIEGPTKRSLTKCTSPTVFREYFAILIYPHLVVYNSATIQDKEWKSKHKSVYWLSELKYLVKLQETGAV